jgi:hypothetical protein
MAFELQREATMARPDPVPGRPSDRIRRFLAATATALVCLGLTASPEASADSSHSRWGFTARGGSVAGFTELAGEEVPTIGAQLALGYQLGRLALELEHEQILLLEEKSGERRGRAGRSAINLKLYLLELHRFRSRSVLRAYLEGGVGRTSGTMSAGERFSRLETAAGAGLLLDHRALSGGDGLRFAGWHLGWSLRASPGAATSPSQASACAASKDRLCASPPTTDRPVDLGLLVSSAMAFNW